MAVEMVSRSPHFSDDDDVRVLAQDVDQRLAEGGGVGVHFLLDDDGHAVVVGIFDGILDHDDLDAALAVDDIDHVVEGGGLARAGGTSDQHQAAGQPRERFDDLGQPQLLARANHAFRDADGHLRIPAADVDQRAEPGDPGPEVRDAQLRLFGEGFVLARVDEDTIDHGLEGILVEGFALGDADFAVDAERRRDAADEVDVAGMMFLGELDDLFKRPRHNPSFLSQAHHAAGISGAAAGRWTIRRLPVKSACGARRNDWA